MIKYFLHTSTATLFFYYNIIIIIINRSSGTFSPRYTSPSHPPTHSLTHLSPTTPLSRTRKLRHCESKITLKGLLNFLIFLIVWCFMFLGYWIQLGRSFSYVGYDFSSHCFFFIVFEIVKEKKNHWSLMLLSDMSTWFMIIGCNLDHNSWRFLSFFSCEKHIFWLMDKG